VRDERSRHHGPERRLEGERPLTRLFVHPATAVEMDERVGAIRAASELVVADMRSSLDRRLEVRERRLCALGEAQELAEVEEDTRFELLVTPRFGERLTPERDGLHRSTGLGPQPTEPEQKRPASRPAGRFLAHGLEHADRTLHVPCVEVQVGGTHAAFPSPRAVVRRR
jgi:hypothetical protein